VHDAHAHTTYICVCMHILHTYVYACIYIYTYECNITLLRENFKYYGSLILEEYHKLLPFISINICHWVPYSYKFLRDVYFAVFADNMWSTKIKFSKIYNSIDIILCRNPMILKNIITKMLNLWHQQNIHPSKICMSTVFSVIFV